MLHCFTGAGIILLSGCLQNPHPAPPTFYPLPPPPPSCLGMKSHTILIFVSLRISVKHQAERETASENCIQIKPTVYLSILLVRLLWRLCRNCLCNMLIWMVQEMKKMSNYILNAAIIQQVWKAFWVGVLAVWGHKIYIVSTLTALSEHMEKARRCYHRHSTGEVP